MASIRFQCTECGQHLEAPEEAASLPVSCPTCQAKLRVPDKPAGVAAAPGPAAPGRSPGAAVCAICLSPMGLEEAKTACPACSAEYHAECWEENGGCAVYGCEQVPEVEHRQSIEIPMSYWGQENKPCPACGREILAAAIRCRHCGATFETARPEEKVEFLQRTALQLRAPQLRRRVLWLFIVCLVPCGAPVGAIWGGIWYPAHREELRALPALYPALCKIGIGVAITETVMFVLMAILFNLVRGSGT